VVNEQLELVAALREARSALDAASDGHLVLPVRKRVLVALGEPQYEPRGSGHGVVTVGLRRRVGLYTRCTRKVLPLWHDVVESRDPELMLELAEGYLAGTVSRDIAWRMQNTFGGTLLNAGAALPPDKYCVSYVGNVAVGTVLTALGDVYFDPEQSSFLDDDFDVYEASLFAMGAYAGELPWGDGSDPARRREFWTWWIDEAVPAAAASA
jgi:hypothetical protein